MYFLQYRKLDNIYDEIIQYTWTQIIEKLVMPGIEPGSPAWKKAHMLDSLYLLSYEGLMYGQ